MHARLFVRRSADTWRDRIGSWATLAAVADTCAPQDRPIADNIGDACVRARMHAIGWQLRRRRRLCCRRSRRPSSAVPPVSPAAYVRRSNQCACAWLTRRRRVVCSSARCVRACVRACPPVALRGPAVSIDRRAGVRFAFQSSVGPQVPRGRAARKARRGLREKGTRP